MNLPREATSRELAVLRNADQSSSWAVALSAHLAAPGPRAEDLSRLAQSDPIVAARWTAGRWAAGEPPVIVHADLSEMLGRFDLANAPPLRVALSPDGTALHVVGHHAAFDGRALVTVVARLLGKGSPRAEPVDARPASSPDVPASTALSRLARPAGRARRSNPSPQSEILVSRDIVLGGGSVTSRLAATAAYAIAAHNVDGDAAIRRIGVSIGVGGTTDIGNTASYRRIDVGHPDQVLAAVRSALSSPQEPPVLRHPSRLLRLLGPIANRLSDTFLVSNLGRVDIPGVGRLEFYPVARGRSAVAFGAVGVKGGPSTVTIRSLYLSPEDATAILDDVVRRLESDGPSDGG